eukprot:tig00000254_g22522.t1
MKKASAGGMEDMTRMRSARPRLLRLVRVAGAGPAPGQLHFSEARRGVAWEDLGAFSAQGQIHAGGRLSYAYTFQLPASLPPSVQGRSFAYGYAIELTVLSEVDDDQRGDMPIEIGSRRAGAAVAGGRTASPPRAGSAHAQYPYGEAGGMVRPPAVALRR